MKFFKPVLLMVLLSSIVGCGTSQAPAVNLGMGQYPYNNWNNNNGSWGWGQNGWNSGLPGGGTKQMIPLISGYGYANAQKQFMTSQAVQVGDQIEVQAAGAQVYAQGWFGASNMLGLTGIRVRVGNQELGSSTYAKYNIQQAGAVTLYAELNGVTGAFGANAQYAVAFPYGGVWINRCSDSTGKSIACP